MMTNEDKIAELVSAITAILEAAERGDDEDHNALAVIRMECTDVFQAISL